MADTHSRRTPACRNACSRNTPDANTHAAVAFSSPLNSSPIGNTLSSPNTDRKRGRTPQSHSRFAASTPDASPPPSSEGGAEPNAQPSMFVWGTGINVQDVNAVILLMFLRNLRCSQDEEGKCMKAINHAIEMGGESLDVDAMMSLTMITTFIPRWFGIPWKFLPFLILCSWICKERRVNHRDTGRCGQGRLLDYRQPLGSPRCAKTLPPPTESTTVK